MTTLKITDSNGTAVLIEDEATSVDQFYELFHRALLALGFHPSHLRDCEKCRDDG